MLQRNILLYLNWTTIPGILTLAMLFSAHLDAQVGGGQFTSYECHPKSADEVAAILRPLLPPSPSVQLVVDREQNRILLSGEDDVQGIARRVLAELVRPAAPPPAALPPRLQPDAPSAARNENLARFIYVLPARFLALQQQLSAMFGDRLRVRRVGSREILLLELSPQPPQHLEIEFDQPRSGVLVGGPANAVNQVAVLLQALAGDHSKSGLRTQVFRVHRTNHRSLQQLIQPEAVPDSPPSASDRDIDAMGHVPARFPHSPVVPARYLFQDERAADPPAPQPANPPNGAEPQANPLRQFEGVEIESLPDLDVIILRGRDGDLDQLAEIIQQL